MADLKLDPAKTALVSIDLQNALMGLNTAPYSPADVVAKNRRIADALRAQGGLIVWVRVNLNDFLSLPVDQAPQFGGQQMPDELSQIASTAGFQAEDALVTKRHWGAFAGTSLEEQLRARGIDTVILTGISTNIGVESTLRQGTGLGFAFVVPEDACSSQDADDHAYAVEKVFPRLARVRSTSEVIAAFERES